MPNVYVINALNARGGSYMNYHIGRLIHQHYGHTLINVPLVRPGDPVFDYDTPMHSVSREAMERKIEADDFLVCGPPAASEHMFGLRLPGKKIMYVQGFQTFRYLDCHFDSYACVGTVVRDFLDVTYGIKAPIIPPFIQLDALPSAPPWHERPKASAIVYMPRRIPEISHVYRWMDEHFGRHYPELQINQLHDTAILPQQEFLRRIGSVQYLINLSIAEGFGLVPLEAMAMGTIPIGLNGLSGRDYLRYGENSFCCDFKDIKQLIVPRNQPLPKPPASFFAPYSKEAFTKSWMQHLSKTLG